MTEDIFTTLNRVSIIAYAKYHDYSFYPGRDKECLICGIDSFAHIHPAGSKPKDFTRLIELADYVPDTVKIKPLEGYGIGIPEILQKLEEIIDYINENNNTKPNS